MSEVKINRARRIAQTQTKSFKSNIMPVGAILAVLSLEEGTIKVEGKQDVYNDVLLCSHLDTGKTIKLPLREFNKMKTSEGNDLVRASEGGEETFPQSIIIKSSKNREGKDKDGNSAPFYPAYAYNGSDDFYNAIGTDNEMEWSDLLETGVKDDNTFDHVQDYVIETKF